MNAKRGSHRPKRRWLGNIFNFAKPSIDMWSESDQASLQEVSTPNDAIHVLFKIAGTDARRSLDDAFT